MHYASFPIRIEQDAALGYKAVVVIGQTMFIAPGFSKQAALHKMRAMLQQDDGKVITTND